jgi:uncharacterized protein
MTREKTGQPNNWLYSSFRWLSEKEALCAQKKRAKILAKLAPGLHYHCLNSKLSTGTLSPGCILCGSGRWSCLFVNGLCTANCFYCPQDRTVKEERAPFSQEGLNFRSPEEYIDFLRKFGFRGVGFSGGESLLAFKTVTRFIQKIRGAFKNNMYLWLYTNGQMVDSGKLRRLHQLGLNEIRFNISADNYDLGPVALAARIMDTVTVEIPAIPEDFAKVQAKLREMQEIGVQFLNLHQLSTTKYNYKNFLARGYTFLSQPRLPVLESEMTALRILQYALNIRLHLPVHYCSCAYQYRFQTAGMRRRSGLLSIDSGEEITPAGFIRSISLRGNPAALEKTAAALKRQRCACRLHTNAFSGELFFNRSALKYIHPPAQKITIRYFEPQLHNTSAAGGNTKEIALGTKRKLFISKELRGKYLRIKPRVFRDWRKLTSPCGKKAKDRDEPVSTQQRIKPEFAAKWERVEKGFPPIR